MQGRLLLKSNFMNEDKNKKKTLTISSKFNKKIDVSSIKKKDSKKCHCSTVFSDSLKKPEFSDNLVMSATSFLCGD